MIIKSEIYFYTDIIPDSREGYPIFYIRIFSVLSIFLYKEKRTRICNIEEYIVIGIILSSISSILDDYITISIDTPYIIGISSIENRASISSYLRIHISAKTTLISFISSK